MEIYVVEYNPYMSQFDGVEERNCIFSTFKKAMQWVKKEQNEVFTDFNFEVTSDYYYKDNDEHFYRSRAILDKICGFDITIYKAIVDENA